ncbi:MAG: hypothetical protein ACFCUS_13005 [Rubrimonas sp.]|uniref:hypothetical protein n=1 Tax=Rubrimonas sp. TaxID=2036015 RepID=UPI002FDC8232
MSASVVFAPLLPWALLAAGAALALAAAGLALWRGSPGWLLRALAFAILLFALTNPSLLRENRRALPDIAFLIVDESASQTVGDRPTQTAQAAAEIEAAIAALAARGAPDAPLELRVARVASDPAEDRGTALLSALETAAADAAPSQIAGALLLTDGRAHDLDRLSAFPGPVHALVTGEPDERDLRLVLQTAPTFGIVGETATAVARVEALGAAPQGAPVELSVSVDGGPPRRIPARVGESVPVEIEITHGGPNVVELRLPAAQDELTDRNNAAVFTVNGVRDRLRVLLVSGEPHPGERTWRNLLKADPAVDLVHFTILRPPAKQDGTPVYELSLIAFPTRELFMEKVDEFDLIIFDRYRRRGILPTPYIANVARYVREGGAVLLAEGDSFAGVESLYRTPLADVIPARPTAGVLEEGYLPRVTELGRRHPVTAGLGGDAGAPGEAPPWGRWFRHVEIEPLSGETVMTGARDLPLMILDRVGEGRVAVLASDQAWLWTRGYEGGGPQAELLRRLAHWLMKEPDLEEEALTASVEGAVLRAERRSIGDGPETLTVTAPSGATLSAPFAELRPGLWAARIETTEQGLHRLSDGTLEAVAAVGPPAPREFENPVSTTELLAPLAEATGGASRRLTDGLPDLRRVAEGRVAEGRGWLGLTRRGAYAVEDVRLTPLAPAWAMLLVTALLLVGAWRVEGR